MIHNLKSVGIALLMFIISGCSALSFPHYLGEKQLQPQEFGAIDPQQLSVKLILEDSARLAVDTTWLTVNYAQGEHTQSTALSLQLVQSSSLAAEQGWILVMPARTEYVLSLTDASQQQLQLMQQKANENLTGSFQVALNTHVDLVDKKASQACMQTYLRLDTQAEYQPLQKSQVVQF
ncbi:hypothetical protein [Paraferrimonas haliotis]|uniref:hypothetical protein n=1 Tax=Paraferrimonas haliotis TaxID=2013866 RepID=UPI000BA97BF2|nr:hypothetical protein [Paraferrimonas haliotis]